MQREHINNDDAIKIEIFIIKKSVLHVQYAY